ncbi:GRP family sugar transporter [Actinomyces urogenitalis]|uniref:DMT superfamily drug/metabolite transporter n=1 Tax=Actinomyces urogenitalis DORA_12 TaxID=1403939 RepID=W1VK61_9ACTO|nr:GRP family sugar transporter [Actinomyces urogenitalis]ETJ06403.1 MAG: DMT superfamily drug/metabolite transporter [Actinomyces urogenitalis DORA_12]KGF03292.1 multidrug DMT transporter permease [Actinomyces urogenitalis S6-C4]MBS5977148.1 multidrug DMT transporter permease [Actinomyces urogenitalis]MDK8237858.1 GRP family sugar transporter [Actinomyces urogenitalis]MDU0865358.1 GRP family sugar transporter [Actinomyces urogenitalis]
MAFLLALLPCFLFGTQQLIMGAWPARPRRQNVAVLAGAGVVSVVAAPLTGGAWSLHATFWGVLSGVLWATALVFTLRAFQSWGVSRTMPLNASGQIIINALAGIILLGEWRAPGAMPLGLTALVAIIAGAASCSWQEKGAGSGPTPAQHREGLICSIICSVLYGIYPFMLRLVDVSSSDAVGPMGIGLLLGAAVFTVILPREEPLVGEAFTPSAIGGGLWAVGNVILLLSTSTVGVATSLALSQLAFVISSVGGIILLGETRTRREALTTALGITLAVVGIILLALASSR